MNIYTATEMTKLYSDVIWERAGLLGIPYEVFHKVATARPKTSLLRHELIEQFRQSRGYVFDWGWIVERRSNVDFGDNTGPQDAVSFGVLPICLFAEMNFGTARQYWNRLINPYVIDSWRDLPVKFQGYFDYCNDFTIEPGQPYEMFAIKAEGDGCIYGTRRWLAAYFLPIVMPAFVHWVEKREQRVETLFTLFEQQYARTYPKQTTRVKSKGAADVVHTG